MEQYRLTVIMHFYNEELLLPYWLRHHRRIFDHGILIDYMSTDRSIEIVEEIVPGWQLVHSTNDLFTPVTNDPEVMAWEELIDGWKISLNVTEFLFHEDVRARIRATEDEHQHGGKAVGLPVYTIVDNNRNTPLHPVVDLWRQRHWGHPGAKLRGSCRWLHRFPHGDYLPGRHETKHPSCVDDQMSVLWFGWAPLDQAKERKFQIQHRMPPTHPEVGMGRQHILDDEKYERRYAEELAESFDLRKDPRFRRTWDLLDGDRA